MDSFVNRQAELQMIDYAFGDLLSKDRLLQTPILDFYGVEGIGKTSILHKVVEKCHETKVPYIQANASYNVSEFLLSIREQARKYAMQPLLDQDDGDELNQSVALTKTLLEQGPLVMLLDAVDATNEQQMEQIEHMLSELLVYNKLFVVLASRRKIAFEREKFVARKLTLHEVQPFDRESCELYLDTIQHTLEQGVREQIFEWTRGYPLAMNVMVEAITQSGIDTTSERGRNTLINLLFERVIIKGLLASARPDEHEWFESALHLLAIPRRFNLVIMQKLIEQFEPGMKLPNSLAYIVLPKRIGQATGVLGWNLDRAGYTIDEPVRNILLLHLKMNFPERYRAISRFLAELNWQNAIDVTGSDRIRYQREYLYHSVVSVDNDQLLPILQQTIRLIIQDAQESPDQLVQFSEEFHQDMELQEALGEHVGIVLDLIYTELAQKMRDLASQEADREKRKRYLYNFLSYTIRGMNKNSLSLLLKEQIEHLITQEDPTLLLELYEELGKDGTFREALGEDFAVLRQRIRDRISPEREDEHV